MIEKSTASNGAVRITTSTALVIAIESQRIPKKQ